MSIRRIVFWTHLTAGSLAGIVILVMSFTGVLLAYQRQITAWVNRGYRSTAPGPGATVLPIGDVLAKACLANPATPSMVTAHSDPAFPVEIAYGRNRTVYFDAYTGAAIGLASQRTRNFFQAVEGWHRWLGVSLEHRAAARMVTGISTLAFLVLVSSGIILWWPRSWSPQRLKAAATWRWNPPANRARPWNWHTVTGFWCFVPLFVIILCGVIMAFPWANNLLYRASGNPPPPVLTQDAAATAPAVARRSANEEGSGFASARRSESCVDAARVDALWDRADSQVPGWQTVSWRAAPNVGHSALFTIDRGNGGRPDQRAQLTLDAETARIIRWEPFSSYNLGRRLRAWVRFTHTGEDGGLWGETLAALSTTGTMVLVITGLTMAWTRFLKRLFASSSRRKPEYEPPDVSTLAETRGVVRAKSLEADSTFRRTADDCN